jgi:hypothetical protein
MQEQLPLLARQAGLILFTDAVGVGGGGVGFNLLVEYMEGSLVFYAGIFKQSMGAWIRVEIWLSYRLARIHRLAELTPWNRFLSSLKV